jgi:adenylate kinase
MIIIFFGLPGSGKTTQAEIISQRFNLKFISLGNILREEKTQCLMSTEIKINFLKGDLLPDDFINLIAVQEIKDAKNQVILEGYPRTLKQAEFFDDYLKNHKLKINYVFFFNIDFLTLKERLEKRLYCSSCKQNYTSSEVINNQCKFDNNFLKKRDDDQEIIIENRIKNYQEKTNALISFYKKQDLLFSLDAAQDKAFVTKKIFEIIKNDY